VKTAGGENCPQGSESTRQQLKKGSPSDKGGGENMAIKASETVKKRKGPKRLRKKRYHRGGDAIRENPKKKNCTAKKGGRGTGGENFTVIKNSWRSEGG